MARPTPPPAARSSSLSDGGTAPPCASATARSGGSTLASPAATAVLVISDMLDYALGELRGRDLRRLGHLPGQVVGDAGRPDRLPAAPHDRVRPLPPASA